MFLEDRVSFFALHSLIFFRDLAILCIVIHHHLLSDLRYCLACFCLLVFVHVVVPFDVQWRHFVVVVFAVVVELDVVLIVVHWVDLNENVSEGTLDHLK